MAARQFDFTGDYCITGSIAGSLLSAFDASKDRSCKLWDVNNGQCMETLRGHSDEAFGVGSRLYSRL